MAYNTVILKNYGNVFEEYEAYEAMSPGMLVEPRPGYSTIRKHATEGGNAIPMIVCEDVYQGKDITDAYVAGDKVKVWIPQRGDQGYVQLEDEGEVAIGDFVESNGAGYFQKHVSDDLSSQVTGTVLPLQIIAQVLDKLELSSESTTDSSERPKAQFVRVRFV